MNVPAFRSILPLALVALSACASSNEEPVSFRNVEATCIEAEPAEEDWSCEETRTVACENVDEADLEVMVQYAEGACEDAELQDVEGPFEVGSHTIDIEDAASGEVVCTATLEVVDENPPEYTTEVIELWPPNHKMHDITLDDCITEIIDCDDEVDARVLWVSSDEADNERGDGNTHDDVAIVSDDTVSVRSERSGGGNGRVYVIGFELVDDEGNATEGTCDVWVPHDQSGKTPIDDGPAYVVEADA